MDDQTTDEAPDATADWQTVEVVGTEEEAALVAGFLNNNGIEAQVESLFSSEFPTDFGALGEVHVMVRAGQLAEAQQLLAESDAVGSPDATDEGEEGE